MCSRQLNSSSIIKAKAPVLKNLFNLTIFKTKIKVKRAKLMFLPSSKWHHFLFLQDVKSMTLLSH